MKDEGTNTHLRTNSPKETAMARTDARRRSRRSREQQILSEDIGIQKDRKMALIACRTSTSLATQRPSRRVRSVPLENFGKNCLSKCSTISPRRGVYLTRPCARGAGHSDGKSQALATNTREVLECDAQHTTEASR